MFDKNENNALRFYYSYRRALSVQFAHVLPDDANCDERTHLQYTKTTVEVGAGLSWTSTRPIPERLH